MQSCQGNLTKFLKVASYEKSSHPSGVPTPLVAIETN